IAIVYKGRRVTIYRDGRRYAEYTMGGAPVAFSSGSVVLIGLRHLDAGGPNAFAGTIDDARIYNAALDADTIASLKPNERSGPKPLGWWNFEGGKAEDVMKTFPAGKLLRGAKIAGGRLHVDGRGAYMAAGKVGRRARVASTGGRTDNARALRDMYLRDPHRPGYHFIVPEGLCGPFDPNAALFWRGRYHLMYIYQGPKGHAWGHMSSRDLVHWRHHPPALAPGEGDNGIFSGGVFVDKKGDGSGVATITYWGLGKPRGICIATSTDDHLDNWTKSPANPVIRETTWGYAVVDSEGGGEPVIYGAADPSAIWKRAGRYYMLTGNLLVLNEYGKKRKIPEHMGDTLYLFVSDDMVKWKYLHRFYESDRKWTRADEDNMCPDFFPLPGSSKGGEASDRHMILFISHNLGCQYYIGRYEGDRFHPERHGRMTWVDKAFFAPESLIDERGRRIMWAWIFDGRGRGARGASGWSGTMSLPRLLWLGEDGTLRMRPPEELETLRYNGQSRDNLTVEAGSELKLDDIRGRSIELSLEMAPRGAKQFGVKVCCSPGGEEETLVFYDAAEKKLKVDTRNSSQREGPKKVEAGPFELGPGEPLRLRVFVDKSVVEVFANDRQAVARRIYPSREDSVGVALFSNGGETKVPRLEAWDMMPSNPY
ncbi:MAG: GH32 C-terminal domain-containing protein, partial [Planctomycetota bacterium]